MTRTISAEVLKELHGHIDREIAAGFLPPVQIAQYAVEALTADADLEALYMEADKAVSVALEAHILAQIPWPAVTDCDRLDAAFDQLQEAGIITRQDFSCCGTCGAAEILDEMAAERAQGRNVCGYAFFHAQDTESAIEGHGLCLNYGTDQNDEETALGVARKVVNVLQAHGLSTAWDGSWNQRIAVALDWKRRRKR